MRSWAGVTQSAAELYDLGLSAARSRCLATLIFCSILAAPPGNIWAQWQSETRMTYEAASSQTSLNNSSGIAANGDTVFVVWYDSRDGNPEIYYKRSPDAGVSWGTDKRLTNEAAESWFPSIAVAGSFLHVVWQDRRTGYWETYYKRSTDGGLTWGPDTLLPTPLSDTWQPAVCAAGQAVFVAWQDTRDGNEEVYWKRSTDGGRTWGADKRVTVNSFTSSPPSVAESGGVVHLVWQDNRDLNWEIYYNRSTDGGVTWGSGTRLTVDTSFQAYPSIAASLPAIHVVWQDNRDGSWKIFYARSSDGGISWGPNTRLTNNSKGSGSPSVSAAGEFVHIVWEDFRDNNWEVYYKRSTDGGLTWGTDTRISTGTGSSLSPSVLAIGAAVHVAWDDQRDGNSEIYYRRDPAGNLTDVPGHAAPHPASFRLDQNYPNPFNPTTAVSYQLPAVSEVKLMVYDVLGREVALLVNERKEPGRYEVRFDGSGLSTGVYLCRMQAGAYVETKKLVLLK